LNKNNIASQKLYDQFREYFPFVCVDLVLFNNDLILLSKRTKNPYKGIWHLPGSMVRKNEKIENTVKRTGKTELNLEIDVMTYIGFFQSMDEFRNDISHAFLIQPKNETDKIEQNSNQKFFKNMPKNIVPHHKKTIQKARKILKK
jgi:ADP-ribose pyrophosphatase YjhB (NUDIX family)